MELTNDIDSMSNIISSIKEINSKEDLNELMKIIKMESNKFDNNFFVKIEQYYENNNVGLLNIYGINNSIYNSIKNEYSKDVFNLIQSIEPTTFDLNDFKIRFKSKELKEIENVMKLIENKFGKVDVYFKELVIDTILLKSKEISLEKFVLNNNNFKIKEKALLNELSNYDIKSFEDVFNFYIKLNEKYERSQGPKVFYTLAKEIIEDLQKLPTLNELKSNLNVIITSNNIEYKLKG